MSKLLAGGPGPLPLGTWGIQSFGRDQIWATRPLMTPARRRLVMTMAVCSFSAGVIFSGGCAD